MPWAARNAPAAASIRSGSSRWIVGCLLKSQDPSMVGQPPLMARQLSIKAVSIPGDMGERSCSLEAAYRFGRTTGFFCPRDALSHPHLVHLHLRPLELRLVVPGHELGLGEVGETTSP